jgi:hypothetical protein
MPRGRRPQQAAGDEMRSHVIFVRMKRISFWLLLWTAAISGLHAWLNVSWA